MDEQIAAFSPDLNNNAEESHEGCIWYLSLKNWHVLLRISRSKWNLGVWPEEIMALQKWRTVGQVHIAQGPPPHPLHTHSISEMILANILRECSCEFELVPHPGCAVDRNSTCSQAEVMNVGSEKLRHTLHCYWSPVGSRTLTRR